jgi:mono/diheme cytochrome c family protein
MPCLPTARLPRRFWHYLAAAIAALSLNGCQQKMAGQPSFGPLEPSRFFDDGQSARHLVAGTVARGRLRLDTAFFTGRSSTAQDVITAKQAVPASKPAAQAPAAEEQAAGGFDENRAFTNEFPIPLNESLIMHGFNRYMIYCVVCHDPLGTGRGKIVERGYTSPPSFHIERLRNAPVGRLFAIATEGYGSMPAYGAQIPPEDRWAIVAYLRTLQLSQHFPVADLTPSMRAASDQANAAGSGAPLEELLPSKEAPR